MNAQAPTPVRIPRRVDRITFAQKLERYPPILLRLLTVWGTRGNRWCPTDHEIAAESGLSLADTKCISYSLSWQEITVPKMYAYMKGCRIDLEKRRTFRRLEWMRRRGYFRHLKSSPLWDSMFREMVNLWADSTDDHE